MVSGQLPKSIASRTNMTKVSIQTTKKYVPWLTALCAPFLHFGFSIESAVASGETKVYISDWLVFQLWDRCSYRAVHRQFNKLPSRTWCRILPVSALLRFTAEISSTNVETPFIRRSSLLNPLNEYCAGRKSTGHGRLKSCKALYKVFSNAKVLTAHPLRFL